MANRADLRARVASHLGATIYALYTSPILDAWLDEGLRRCAPVLLAEKSGSITITLTSAALPADCVYALRVYSATVEMPSWRQHGGDVYLDSALAAGVSATVEYLGAWTAPAAGDTAEFPLADFQTDTIVFYANARVYRQLASNRSDYRKYSTVMNNQVDMEDIERLADFWEGQFQSARLESRLHRQVLYEKERQGGGAGVVGNADLR